MSLLWTYTDQQAIRPISENKQQDWEGLATEVQFVKLKEFMGADFYQDVVQNPTTTANAKLIDGGTYTNGTLTYQFQGLKYVLSYLLYARYILESDAQDSFAGFMQIDSENARHSSFAQKKNIAEEQKNLAWGYWNDLGRR